MTPKQAIAFVKANGVVLESGGVPVPSLAQAIAGKPIQGSWWAHPKANIIFLCSRYPQIGRGVGVPPRRR